MQSTDPRQSILSIVKRLEDDGYNLASTGNVSCRDQGGVLITPTGGHSGNLTPERIVRIDADGKVQGEGAPSSEWSMHTAILKAFPEANAVIHTHADSCVVLSSLGKSIPAFHYMLAGFGGNSIRCSRYATFGTADLGDAAVEAMRDRRACLLANHGMVVAGQSLEAALSLVIKLETLARQYLMACQAGEPMIIPDDEMERVLDRYGKYGRTSLPH
ncbi:class II aldolase/adducin family protein [Corticibacterium sp. UT-5YL-CI-8]|nr:class II aldolase/adducin family protein [Tianweitania sp. UT-5YL-CI-8]